MKTFTFYSKPFSGPKYAILSFFLLFTVLLQSQTIKYVTVSGAGSKDGSSWSNASDNLQKTISSASTGTQIWIAKGTYTPKVALAPNNNPQDRNNTFGLKKDVKLYGGFAGNETSVSQRNITANETILSGNLGGGKYAHHVLFIHALEANENYYLDGLTISDGKCDLIELYKISEVTKGLSTNDRLKESYPDWFVSMSESPYYEYTSMGLQLLGLSGLPGVMSVPGGGMHTTEILNTTYPKSNGGGILNVGGVLTLNDVTFKNNSGEYGAAISLQDGAHATLTNCHFNNNRTNDHGGAITTSKSSLIITGGSFINNTSNMGAAIADLGGKLLNINNVLFENNNTVKVKQPYRYGAAIYIEQVTQDVATLRTINNCTFTNNSADYGGAIHADLNIRNLKITNSTFKDNSSVLQATATNFAGGGAIMLHQSLDAEISGNTFTSNNALTGVGGAIFAMRTTGTKILNNTFSTSTSWVGGAVCTIENKGTVTITGNTFSGNKVTQNNLYAASGIGGAITSLRDNNVQMPANTFTGNNAVKLGGAVYFDTSTVTSVIESNTFTSNVAGLMGGGISASSLINGKVIIKNNEFDKNSANERGGAVYVGENTSVNVHNNLFTANESKIGAAIDFESYVTNHFYNNILRGNKGIQAPGNSGNVVSFFEGINKVYNNLFTKNEKFSAVFYSNATVEFVNNTVWNEDPGYGIYLAVSKSSKFYNNILEDLRGSSTTLDVRNNAFTNDSENKFVNKNNNIAETNFYFVDATNYNFNLTGCSTIINKGNNSYYLGDYATTDAANKNRKVNTIDIGAYENEAGVSGKTPPTVVAMQSFCSQNVLINNLAATGSNIKWYSQAVGGSVLASNTPLISGTTYYASQTVSGCESDRTSVLVSINSTDAPTAVTPQNFIIGQPGAKIVVNGSNMKWYTQEVGGTALAVAPTLNMANENSATYWVSQTSANGCESARTKVVVNITKIPLTIKAVNKVKVYDAAVYGNSNYTITFTGFESGDTQANSTAGTLSFTGDATTAKEPGIYKIIPQGITSTKYTVLYEEGTLEIKSNLQLTNNILYVKQNGNVNGDGTSWGSPLNNLELALTKASNINSVHTADNDPKKVKKIFVAKGIYQLNSGKSYIMPKNIEIYGGFDPDNAITDLTHKRITGDVTGGSILRGNSASVIRNDDNGLTDTAVLNGFTITNGSATNGAGIYNKKVLAKFENIIIKANTATANGGGVYNENAITTWVNCLIVGNTAPNGASMYNNEASLPNILNVTIADNTGAEGATLYNKNGSAARVVNTISVRNSSDIFNDNSTPSYENSLIQGVNVVSSNASIIDANYILVTGSSAINGGNKTPANLSLPVKDLIGKTRIIDNNVDMGAFEKNSAQTITAGAITKTYGDAPFTHGTASSGLPLEFTSSSNITVAIIENGKIKILNAGTTIITVNQPGNNDEYDAATTTFNLTVNKKTLTITADNKSKVQDNAVFTGFSVSYTGFIAGDTPTNSLTGNLAYTGTATTATTSGLNYEIIPSGYTSNNYDIIYANGNLTISPNLTIIDGTLYVKKGATGDGTSWSNALGELTDALEIVKIFGNNQNQVTKIFVSKGDYWSKTTESFTMYKGVSMYGGFDPENGITTLSHIRKYGESKLFSGGTGIRILTNDNNLLTHSDILDGFSLLNANPRSITQGGGIYNRNSSPTIINCTISGIELYTYNTIVARTYGGGVYNDNSNPQFINCIIYDNRTGVDGNAINNPDYFGYGAAMYSANNSHPKLYNCTVKGNHAKSNNSIPTSAIEGDSGSATALYNCIYMDNKIANTHNFTALSSIVQKTDNKQIGFYNGVSTEIPLADIFITNSNGLKVNSSAKDKGNDSYYTFTNLSNYDIKGFSRKTGTIDVGAEELRTEQIIIADNLGMTYGNVDFVHPTLTTNSPLEVTYVASSATNVATIVGGKIRILKAGTTTITVKQQENEEYASVTKTFVLTVNKATLTVKANDKTKAANNGIFPSSNLDVTYTGFVNGDDKSKLGGNLTYSGVVTTAKEVGIYTDAIMPGGLSSDNYQITYEPGTLKIIPNTTVTNNTLYVKEGAIGGDGSSWDLALNDLSLALKYAKILNGNATGTVDKIYVAKGTYTPKYSMRDNSNYADEGRDNSFLLSDGLKLYGGFDGNIANETPAERRILENKTILDGQSTIYHIVTVVNSTGNYEIDGFTIYSGAAGNGSAGSVVVNGKTIVREHGAAIRVDKANISIKNCIMAENSSANSAGAIFITDGSNVTIYNSLFYGNSVYNSGAVGSSMVVADSNVKIVNTTFGDTDADSPHILTQGTSNLEIFNSVFNSIPNVKDIQSNAGTITIKNSLLSKAAADYAPMNLTKNIYEEPANFVNVLTNNFDLLPNSPAIDKGDNTLYLDAIGGSNDIASNVRKLNTTIDMGAYEAKINQTITAADISKKYADADFTVGSASSGLNTFTYTSSDKNIAYITNDNKIRIVGVGQATITITQSGNATYGPATKSFVLTVGKGDFVPTLQAQTYTYDGAAKYLNATGLPVGASVTYENNGQINAGTYTVKAIINGGTNYNDVTVTNTLTINKATLSGILFEQKSFVYDGFDKHPVISGTLPEGVNVVYSNTHKNAGSYNDVKASISGNNYNLLELTTSMTITKTDLPVGVLFLDQELVYDGTTKRLALEAVFPEGVTLSYVNNDNVNVGTYDVTVNINGGTNYNNKQLVAKLTILKGTIDTNFVLSSDSFEYDGTEKSIVVTGNISNDETVRYIDNEQIEVGDYKVFAVISKPNYNDKIVEGKLTITPKSLNVIVQGAVSKVYNANESIALEANNFDLVGVLNGDDIKLLHPVAGQLDNKNVGDNKTVTIKGFDLSGTDAKNYVLNTTSTVANIGQVTQKELTVALVGNVSKIFDGSTTATLLANNFDLSVILENDIVTLTNSSVGEYNTKDVGIDKTITVNNLAISGTDALNYRLKTQTISGQIGAITPKIITVTATASQSKTYGGAEPIFAYTVSPSLENGDSFSGALARIAGEDVGTYTIIQGNLSAGANYSITYVDAKFSIGIKTITVTADDFQTKVYGTTNSVFTYSVAPSLVGSDAFSGVLERTIGDNVGTYDITQGTLSAGTNYKLNFISNKYTIIAKPITVTVDDSQNKVYGSVDPTLTFTVAPSLVGTDAFTGSLSRAIGENVDSYAIGQGDLSAGSNYTITFEGNTFEITPRPITVTPEALQNKIYGEEDPTFAYTPSETLLTGNSFTGNLSRVNGENVGSYRYTIGSLSAGSNYTVTLNGLATFAITAKAIMVTANDSQTKIYGTTDPVFTYTVSPSLIGSDAFSGALERAIGDNVGTYAITQGTLTAGDNYTITYSGEDFEITKADQVISWNQTLISNCDIESTIVLTSSSNSGLPIKYTSSNENMVTISNNELIFNHFGSATITASQEGDNNYNAAEAISLPVLNSQPNLIRQQFDNVIFFDNSSKEFKSYTWYKNGNLVADQTLQYYKETGSLNGTYYAVATKLDGTVVTSCPLILSSAQTVESIKLVPNPVSRNESYQLITNIDSAKMKNARIEVFALNGSLVDQTTTNENEITLQAPSVVAVYIVRITLANGKTFTKNLLVKN